VSVNGLSAGIFAASLRGGTRRHSAELVDQTFSLASSPTTRVLGRRLDLFGGEVAAGGDVRFEAS